MSQAPHPPPMHEEFVARFPKLHDAWEQIHAAGDEGPLEAKVVRLLKLAVAIGAMREGAVHSNTRKAMAEGIGEAELEQVIAIAAGTLGLPSTVAAYSWVRDYLGKKRP